LTADDPETPPEGAPAIRVVAMPADTNPYGDIFGGWLMSMMDSAAGTVASELSGGRAVTIAADAMSFLRPVGVGDVVSVYAEVIAVGRTSMKLEVQAWRRKRNQGASQKVTHATFTFVAIDENGNPRPVKA
jgi:acyl-CoA thioesterase YciA